MSRKKGEVSTAMIIGLVFLIVSFAVLLIFMFRIDWFDTIDRETCHQSVIYRSTFKTGPIEGSRVIQLKCQTEKICLSMSGDCEELSDTKKNPVRKVKLSRDVEKAVEEIKDVFAEEMVNCHSMLGEGKLNFMPHNWGRKNYGLICSRIVFDDSVKNSIESIGHGDMYAYLEGKVASEGKSYLEYLYPGWKRSKNSVNLFESFKSEGSEFSNVGFDNWKMNLDREGGYVIIAQIAPESVWDSWGKGVATAVAIPVGVALIATGVGAPAGAVLIAGAATITTVSLVSGGAVLWYSYDDEFYYSPPTIYPFEIKVLKDLGISSFEIAP
ncbi:hypothetical protein HOE04_05545 [archaeon]|jgi:hypothetical protein|nr:hypothetical protein [archaeon]